MDIREHWAGMNIRQKWAIGIGVTIGVLMLLYPPWTGGIDSEAIDALGSATHKNLPTVYRFIFDPPKGQSEIETLVPLFPEFGGREIRARTTTTYEIDVIRLLIQWGILAGVTAIIVSGLEGSGRRASGSTDTGASTTGGLSVGKSVTDEGESEEASGEPVYRLKVDLPKRIWTSDEILVARVEVKVERATEGQELRARWCVREGFALSQTRFEKEETRAQGSFAARATRDGDCTVSQEITLPLSGLPSPESFTLGLRKHHIPDGLPDECFATLWLYPAMSPIPEYENVVLANAWNDQTRQALDEGRRVLLLTGAKYLRESVSGELLGAVGDVRFPKRHAVGGRASFDRLGASSVRRDAGFSVYASDNHAALREFHRGYAPWPELVRRSDVMMLPTNEGFSSEVIASVWRRNKAVEVPFLYGALLLEVAVGQGRLLVCSIDLQSDLAQRPEARQLLCSLLAYLAGDELAWLGSARPYTCQQMDRFFAPLDYSI